MTIMQTIEVRGHDAITVLIAGLESEFGKGVGAGLAERFMAAEEIDVHRDAKVLERFPGARRSLDDENVEMDRVAIMGRLDGLWFTAIVIVDGEGRAHAMIAQRRFRSERAARKAWAMPADRAWQQEAERQRLRVAPRLFEVGVGPGGVGGGMQDKGRPSLGLLSVCLHILFERDCFSRRGDSSRPMCENRRNCGVRCETWPRAACRWRADR